MLGWALARRWDDSQEVLQPAGRRLLIEQPGRKVAKDPEAVEPKLVLRLLIS